MKTLVLLSAALSVVLAASAEDASQVVSLTADTFDEQVAQNSHLVMFYAPWCGHCKRLHPTWDELAVKFNVAEEQEVVIANVDCTVHTAVCSDNGVSGYPTIKFFKKDEDVKKAEKYRGARDIDALTKYVKKSLGQEVEEEAIVPEDAKVEKGLYILTERSFAKHIESKEGSFVKFYAPWCGHCQKLAPAWDELAESYEKNDKYSVAKIDCTQHQSICQEQEVKGYPTLLFFKKGKKVETYKGGRTLKDLKDFMASMGESADKAAQEQDKVPEKSDVLVLNKDSFEEGVKSGVSFVKFYAPWCGHCKRLAPTWEELAGKFAGKKDVNIAKVDCTANDNQNKELCNDHGVKGFPTLLVFKNGKKIEEFNGKRTIEDLASFVDKHADKKDEL